MDYVELILATGASILFLALVFIPMEKVFPAKPSQKILREHWTVDLCFLLGQYLLWNGLVLGILVYVQPAITLAAPISLQLYIHAQSIWLQAVEVLVLSDLIIYWGHRLQHNVGFLWRFHKVHHSAKTMDWLAAHREHPLDTLYTVGLINLPAFVIGFDLESISMIVAFRGIWAIYIHSNVRFPIGPLKKLIGSPELHHWHHDVERDRGNYANISPLMDIVFGTYVCPDHEPQTFGIAEDVPTTYLGQIVEPLLPRQLLAKRNVHHDRRNTERIETP